MQIKDFLIVLIVVGLVAYCASGAVYILNLGYNPNSPTTLPVIDDMGNDLNAGSGNATAIYNIVNTNQTITAGGVTGVIFNGIGNFFNSIFNMITMPIKWIVSLGQYLGIPPVIYTAITTILLIALTLAVISAILRRTP